MVEIRPMTQADWPAVEAIYAEGIATGDATFETETPAWAKFDEDRLPDHRLVAVDGDRVVGWAALAPTSRRASYAGVVEHSAYVEEGSRGRGIGHALLEALVASTDAAGIWTIQTRCGRWGNLPVPPDPFHWSASRTRRFASSPRMPQAWRSTSASGSGSSDAASGSPN